MLYSALQHLTALDSSARNFTKQGTGDTWLKHKNTIWRRDGNTPAGVSVKIGFVISCFLAGAIGWIFALVCRGISQGFNFYCEPPPRIS